jgi:hypothetical protein
MDRRTWLNRTQISEHCEHITIKGRLNMVLGNRKDILELDELSNDCLKANFGYTKAGIENLRDQAKQIRKEEVA